jgi:hypothetical protein
VSDLDLAVTTALEAAGGNGLSLARLEELCVNTDPLLASSPDRRRIIGELTARLEASGVLRLPSRRADWDRSGLPVLPLWVRPPLGSMARPGPASSTLPAYLRPELSAARLLGNLSPAELKTLDAVNSWLVERLGQPLLVVPHRERSLELFGDEKRLDHLLKTRLFSEGQISLELLSCVWVPIQIPWRRVGTGSEVLVVENSATYHSLCAVLGDEPGEMGVVAYGNGNSFAKSLPGLNDPDIGPVDIIWYFGDFDAAGLDIPRAASSSAVATGLPTPIPALWLYELLFEHGHPEPAVPLEPSRAKELAAWLGPLRDQAEHLLLSGVRLAQEAVGLELLTKK